MKTLAGYFKLNGEQAPNTYGLTPNDNLHWDEEEMYGCSCDDGFTGYDCSQRMCPFGDDPYTLHQENHQRVLKCTGTSGTFKIKFRGEITLDINAFDTKDQMKEKLEAIKTIDSVQITFTDSTAFTVCTSGGTNVVIIKFLSQTGGSPWIDQFLRRTTTSPPNIYLEDVANTISNEQRKGGKYSKDALRKTLEDESEMISGSADGILRGIIVLEEKVDKNNQNVWVTLGVSRRTVQAAAGLKRSINSPKSSSQRSTTYQMKDPLEDGGVIIRRSRNFDNF